jgi:hypothetical protein
MLPAGISCLANMPIPTSGMVAGATPTACRPSLSEDTMAAFNSEFAAASSGLVLGVYYPFFHEGQNG